VRHSVAQRAGVWSLLAMLSAVGCSSSSDEESRLEGIVQSGGNASVRGLANAAVRVFEATEGAPRLLASTTSSRDGRFAVALPALDPDGVRYVSATVSDAVELVAVLGGGALAMVTVNELTTVAAAYAFAQLFVGSAIQGGSLALSIAAGMNANLVAVATGQPSPVLLASPNADQTNSLRSTRSLANLLTACVDAPASGCPPLFALTTPPGALSPADTIQALVSLARNPAVNVTEIFAQSQVVDLYQPALETAPDAWTLTVKVNETGSDAFPFGGTANTVFDDRGYAWVNNNTIQGTSRSTMTVIVLKPDGSPADGSDGTPTSPLRGGGVLGAGFGISRNPVDGSIWVGDFGWGGDNPGPRPRGNGNGSVSQFAAEGTALSPSTAWDGGTDRVQGTVADRDGNIWSANFGNDKLIVFPDGDPGRAIAADVPCHPFGIAIAADGSAWVTTMGEALLNDADPCDPPATVSHWRLQGDTLEQLSLTEVGDANKGLDIDFEGFVWVGSGGDDTVYRLAPDGTVVGAYQGGGIDTPWSVRIDDAGNVWVANFGKMAVVPPDNIYLDSALSVLAGPNSPSGLPVGTPISPPTGYTVPSAGDPVLLSDGTPLSDVPPGGQPAFTPMMRTVSAVPDRAGNVWVSNNWKPNFTSDVMDNPGGDGMVIFVGLAAPTEPGRTQ
jgi:hypothetical protein